MKNLQRVISLVLIVTLLSESVLAATFVVDRADNSQGANGCLDGTDDDCSLYGAIGAANAAGGTNFIVFDDGSVSPDETAITTVTIDANGLPLITVSNLTINGDFYTADDTPDVNIDGNGANQQSDSVLFGVSAAGVTINGLNIYNWGGIGFSLEADNATVSNNRIGVNGSDAIVGSQLTKGMDIVANNATIDGNVISGINVDGEFTGNGIVMGTMPGPIGGLSITNNKIGTNSAGTAVVGNDASGIVIMGNTNGANVISGNVLSGNATAGIEFAAMGDLDGTYNVFGNKIGTNAAGTAAIANGTGILAAANGSSVLDITIGGDEIAERNIISGNTGDGISIASADTAVVSGNYIGTAADGTTQLGNGADGVQVNATTLVQIGSDNDGDATDGAEWNTISGNVLNGIHVVGAGLATIRIIGNYIGLNKNGAVGVNMGNGGAGVLVNASAATVLTIGSPKAGDDSVENYIGNNGSGIDIQNTGAGAAITIQNNIVGLDSNEADADNSGVGVKVNLSSGTSTVTIGADGTPLTTERNVISNGVTGIYLGNGVVTGTIKRNFIGLKQSLGEYIGNAGNAGGVAESGGGVGIYVNSADANLNTLNIGGTTIAEYNFIGFNGGYAVHVKDAGTNPANVNIIGNIMGWGQDGTTPAANAKGILIADGNAVAVSNNAIGNTSGGGPLDVTGGVTLTVTGNSIGQSFDASVAGLNAGTAALLVNAATLTSVIIGGATAALGNVFAASAGGGIQISNVAANDTPIIIAGNYIGVCADAEAGVISVDIIADCDNAGMGIYGMEGAFEIGEENELGDAGTGLIAGANVISNNGQSGIFLTDNVTTASILSNIIGLVRNGDDGVFNVAAGNGGTGIAIDTDVMTELILGMVGEILASSGRLIIASNGEMGVAVDFSGEGGYTGLTTTMKNVFIGTDWLGTTARANESAIGGGFAYTTGGTLNIGGTGDDEGNVISGNVGAGVFIWTPYVLTANILGNVIGLAYGGAADLGNGSDGVYMHSDSINTDFNLGNGTVAGRNIIAGNGSYGVNVGAGDITIKGNYLGVAADGTTSVTNTTSEIYAEDSEGSISNLTVGGAVAGEENTINNTTAHVGFTTNIAASNEATLDEDNTWLETTIDDATTPTNRFWERAVDAVVLAWGPYQCNDGIDNDGDGNIDNGVDAGCSTIYDNTENSDVAEEEPAAAPSGGGYIAVNNSSNNNSTTTSTTTEPTEPTTTKPTEPTTTKPTEPTTTKPTELTEPTEPTSIQKAIAKQLINESINSTTSLVSDDGPSVSLLYGPVEEVGAQFVNLPKPSLTSEAQKVSGAFDKSASEALTWEENKEFEANASIAVKQQIDKALDKGASLKLDGDAKEINKDTNIIFINDIEKSKACQKEADKNGENTVCISNATTINGVSVILATANGADLNNPNLADQIFHAGGVEGLWANSVEEVKPKKVSITNVNGGTVGSNPSFWVSGKAGEKVTVFVVIKDADGKVSKVEELGKVEIDAKGKAVLPANLSILGDEAMDVEVITEGKNGGTKILVHYDPNVTEEIDYFNMNNDKLAKAKSKTDESSDLLTSVLFASSLVPSELIDEEVDMESEETRYINGYAQPGTIIMVTWESVTYNSVVVADASQGYFEVPVPKELEKGDHTAVAYSYHKVDKKLSNYTQLFFNKVF